MINDNWLPMAEHITVLATVQGAQVIGLAAPEGPSNVTGVARLVARTFVQSGVPTLLLDVSAVSADASLAESVASDAQAWRKEPGTDGVVTVTAMPTPSTRHLFGNPMWLRQSLAEELANYPKVVVDLPALCADQSHAINPLGPAALCDWLVLVCARGRTTKARLDESMNLLQLAHINLAGTILDETDYATAGEEIARTARRFRWMLPGLSGRIQTAAVNSELLR